MNHTNTGGPAFPIFPDTATGHASAFPGMTLRDYFAAKAMQGMLACPVRPQSGADMYARDAYCVADAMLDAMLKEREA
jgi:hypothetical protein